MRCIAADNSDLQPSYILAVKVSLIVSVILILLIPLPLFFSSYIFPKGGYTAWVIISFVWVFYGTGAVRSFLPLGRGRVLMQSVQVVVYPMWESRQGLKEIGAHIVRDVFGGGKGVKKEVVQA